MSDPHLGQVVVATEVVTPGLGPRRTRNIVLLLAGSVALMMTGSGMIMPVFAKRLDELGSGVQALSFLSMSFALAQLVSSPLLGALADRIGRRPLVLVALASFTAANVGFALAPSTPVLVVIRALGGALTAGLFPASTSIIADIVPERERSRWIGIVMGSYGAGLILGPVVGGVLYDLWGYVAPFAASASMAATALVAATILVPETRTRAVRHRAMLRQRWTTAHAAHPPSSQPGESFWAAIPRPLTIFGTLLLIDFVATFSFTFSDPQMMFFIYRDLGWTATRFGFVAGAYGLSMVLGQTLLGQASDRLGRKPMIAVGLCLTATFFAGLVFARSFWLIALVAIVAGLGEALAAPARSAFYFDITAEEHRSRIIGIKGSAGSLGGVVGPLLAVGASAVLGPRAAFIISGSTLVAAALLALVLLKEPHHVVSEVKDVAWQVSDRRALAAQAALRGVILRARAARRTRSVT